LWTRSAFKAAAEQPVAWVARRRASVRRMTTQRIYWGEPELLLLQRFYERFIYSLGWNCFNQ